EPYVLLEILFRVLLERLDLGLSFEDGRVDDPHRHEEVALELVGEERLYGEHRVDAEAREAADEHDGDGFVATDFPLLMGVWTDRNVEQLLIEAAKLLAYTRVVPLDEEREGDERGCHDHGEPSSLGEFLDNADDQDRQTHRQPRSVNRQVATPPFVGRVM